MPGVEETLVTCLQNTACKITDNTENTVRNKKQTTNLSCGDQQVEILSKRNSSTLCLSSMSILFTYLPSTRPGEIQLMQTIEQWSKRYHYSISALEFFPLQCSQYYCL